MDKFGLLGAAFQPDPYDDLTDPFGGLQLDGFGSQQDDPFEPIHVDLTEEADPDPLLDDGEDNGGREDFGAFAGLADATPPIAPVATQNREPEPVHVDLTEEAPPSTEGGDEDIVVTGRRPKPARTYETPQEIYDALQDGTFDEDEFMRRRAPPSVEVGEAGEDGQQPDQESPTPESGQRVELRPGGPLVSPETLQAIDAIASVEQNRDLPLPEQARAGQNLVSPPPPVPRQQRENPYATLEWVQRQMAYNRGLQRQAAQHPDDPNAIREARHIHPSDQVIQQWINAHRHDPDAMVRGVDAVARAAYDADETLATLFPDPTTREAVISRAVRNMHDPHGQTSIENYARFAREALQHGVVGAPTTAQTRWEGEEVAYTNQAGLDEANTPTALESLAQGDTAVRQMLYGGVEAVSEVAGADRVAEWAGEGRRANTILLQNAPQGVALENVENVADALAWAKHTFLTQVPMFAVPMGGGVMGAIVRGSLGARLGAFGAGYLLNTGEIEVNNKAIDENARATLITLAGGGAATLLDSVTPGRIGSQLVQRFGKEEAEAMATRILLMPASDRMIRALRGTLREGARDMATEAGTEAAQTGVGAVTSAYETNTPINPDLAWQMFQDGLAGAITGGPVGAGTHAAGEAGAAANARGDLRQALDQMGATQFQQGAGQVATDRSSPSQQAGDIRPVAVDLTGVPSERARPRAGQRPMFAEGPVTSNYGQRHPFRTASGEMSTSNHQGVDVAAPNRSPIPAMVDGTVIHAGPRGGLGNAVAIRGADGRIYWAGHMSRVGVEVGATVRQGETIGRVGMTGNATGPHVHYAVRDANGQSVNPTTLRPQRGAASTGEATTSDVTAREIAAAPVATPDAELEQAFQLSEQEQARIEALDEEDTASEAEATHERAVNAPTVEEAVAAAQEIPTPDPVSHIAEAAHERLDRLASEGLGAQETQEAPIAREPVYGDEDATGNRPIVGSHIPGDPNSFEPIGQEGTVSGAQGLSAAPASSAPSIAETGSAGVSEAPVPNVEMVNNQTVVTNVTPAQAQAIMAAVDATPVPRSDGAMIFPPSALAQVQEAAASVAGTGLTSDIAASLSERLTPEAPPLPASPGVATPTSPEVSPQTSGETPAEPIGSELPTIEEIKAEANARGLKGGARLDFIAGAQSAVFGQGQPAGLSEQRVSRQREGSSWVASRVREARVGKVDLPAATPLTVQSTKMRLSPDMGAQHVVTLSDGSTVTMYRDTDQFGASNPQWYFEDPQGLDGQQGTQGLGDFHLGGTKAEALERLPERVARVRQNQIEQNAREQQTREAPKEYKPSAQMVRDALNRVAEGAQLDNQTQMSRHLKKNGLIRDNAKTGHAVLTKKGREVINPPRELPEHERGPTDLSALGGGPKEPSLTQALADLPNKIAEGVAKAMAKVMPQQAEQKPQVEIGPKLSGGMSIEEAAAVAKASDAAYAAKAKAEGWKVVGPPIPLLSEYTKVGNKTEGSNPGGIYEKNGVRYLVKGNNALVDGIVDQKTSDDRARNEVLASELMRAAGLAAPKMSLVDLEGQYGGGLGVASRMEHILPWERHNRTDMMLAQHDFAVHAWLANYDSVGLPVGDNLALTKGSDKVFNADPGGALLFRAQGKPKYADGQLPHKANEWDSMRKSSQAGQVYGQMTDEALKASAKQLWNISDATIRDLAVDYGPGTAAEKLALGDALVARKEDILDRAGLPQVDPKAGDVPLWQVDFQRGSATLTGENEQSSYMMIGGTNGPATQSDTTASQEADQGGGGPVAAAQEDALVSVTGTETDGQLELYPTTNLGFFGIPEKLVVDGVERSTANSNGDPIAATPQAIRNFWRWFGDSKAVTPDGAPIVFYRGSKSGSVRNFMADRRMFFTDDLSVANSYSKDGYGSDPVTLQAYLRLDNMDTYNAEGRNWTQVVVEEPDDYEVERAREQYREQIAENFDGPAWVTENEDGKWIARHNWKDDEDFETEEEAEQRVQEWNDTALDAALEDAESADIDDLVNAGFLDSGIITRSTDELAEEAEGNDEDDIPDAIWIDDVDDTIDGRGISSTVVIVLNKGANQFNIKNAETNTGKFDPESPLFDQRSVELPPQSMEEQNWPQLHALIQDEVFDELGKMGLPEDIVRVIARLRQNANAKGAFSHATNTILIAARLANGDARTTTRHEAIHYLKANGFFTTEEWAALEAWAKDQKVLLQQVRSDPAYQGLSEAKIIEEAVAEGFARLMGGQQVNVPRGLVATAMEKLRQLVRAILNAMGRKGISHEFAEQVMANVMSGRQVELKAERRLQPNPDTKLLANNQRVRDELAKVRERMHDTGTLETGEELLGKGFWAWTGAELEVVRALDGPDTMFSALDDPTMPDPSRFRALTALSRALKMLGDKQRHAYARINNRLKDYRAQDSIAHDPTDSMKAVIKRHFFQERETNEAVAKRLATELGYDKKTLPEELNFGTLMVADDRGYHIEWFVDNQLRPLLDAMNKGGISQDDLELFLYAKHAPFRNARITKINAEFATPDKPGSGMTDAEAAQIIQDVTDAGKLDEFEAAASIVYEMNQKAQQHRIDSGLLTQQEADQMYPPDEFYVPLRGHQEMDAENAIDWMAVPRKGSGSSGFSIKGSDILRAKGRKTKADDILSYVMAQHMAAIDRSYRHRVAQKMGAAFQADPNVTGDFVTINPVKRVAVWNSAKGIVEYQMQTRLNAVEEQRAIYFRKDGKTYKMLFNEHSPTAMRFVQQAKGMEVQKVSLLVAMMSGMSRMFSRLVTSLSVDFWVTNSQGDTGFAILNAYSLRKKHPGAFKEYLKALPMAVPALIRAAKNDTGAGLASTNQMDIINAERELFGGKIIFNQIDNVQAAQRRLAIEMRQAGRSNVNPLKWGRGLLNFIGAVTDVTDNVHRLAYYVACRKIGLDPIASAKEARQITVDFGQKGALGKKINRGYAFFNVAAIGAHTTQRGLRRTLELTPALLGLGALYAIVGPLLFGNDWDDYTEEEKDRFFLFPNGAGGAFSWRMPHTFGGIIAAGRITTEYVLGQRNQRGEPQTMFDAAANISMAMLNAASPIQGQNWQAIVSPTATDPIVDTMITNENYWGRPIGPVHTGRAGERPLWSRAYDGTAPAWVEAARLISRATGGSNVAGGAIDPSAEGLKYLVDYYTGGPGRSLNNLYGVLTGTRGPTGLPIVRAMVRSPHGDNPDAQEIGQFSQRFHDLQETMERARQEAEATLPDQPNAFITANARLIQFGELPADGRRNLYQHFNYWEGKFRNVENTMDRVGLRDGRNIVDRERRDITLATATSDQPGVVLPVGQPLTDQQIATVLERVRQNRLFTAREFNAAYEQTMLGHMPEVSH